MSEFSLFSLGEADTAPKKEKSRTDQSPEVTINTMESVAEKIENSIFNLVIKAGNDKGSSIATKLGETIIPFIIDVEYSDIVESIVNISTQRIFNDIMSGEETSPAQDHLRNIINKTIADQIETSMKPLHDRLVKILVSSTNSISAPIGGYLGSVSSELEAMGSVDGHIASGLMSQINKSTGGTAKQKWHRAIANVRTYNTWKNVLESLETFSSKQLGIADISSHKKRTYTATMIRSFHHHLSGLALWVPGSAENAADIIEKTGEDPIDFLHL